MHQAENVKYLRVGYAGTGFEFLLARCRTGKDLAAYCRDRRGDKVKATDVGYSVSYREAAIDSVVPEARNGMLVTMHMAVVAQDDAVVELRHWRHEIGHAAFEAGCRWCPADIGSPSELAACVNELLCEAVDL